MLIYGFECEQRMVSVNKEYNCVIDRSGFVVRVSCLLLGL